MDSRPPLPQHEIDRLCELAALGASAAAKALGAMVGFAVAPSAARILAARDRSPTDECACGILITADGDLSGVVAIALPARGRARAIEQLLGRADAAPEMVVSALRELGNILTSHMVSAFADAQGAVAQHSIPELAEPLGSTLHARIAEFASPLRIETDLLGPDGEIVATLVYAPEPRKPGRA